MDSIKISNKSKFNIGDKVRVREDLIINERYGGIIFYHAMKCHEAVDILRIESDRCGKFYYMLTTGFWYSDEMLKPVKPNNQEIQKLYEVE